MFQYLIEDEIGDEIENDEKEEATITTTRKVNLSLDSSRSSKFGLDYRILEIDGRQVPRIYRVEIGLSAHQAGLRDGDYILSINGESTANMSQEQVDEKIKSGELSAIELEVTSRLPVE